MACSNPIIQDDPARQILCKQLINILYHISLSKLKIVYDEFIEVGSFTISHVQRPNLRYLRWEEDLCISFQSQSAPFGQREYEEGNYDDLRRIEYQNWKWQQNEEKKMNIKESTPDWNDIKYNRDHRSHGNCSEYFGCLGWIERFNKQFMGKKRRLFYSSYQY